MHTCYYKKMSKLQTDSDLPQALLQHIADQVRHRRQIKHWSQQELSSHSGVSRRMIAMLEQAESNVSLGILYKIAIALDITIGHLLIGTESEPLAVIEEKQMPVVWRQGKSSARLVLSVRTRQAAEIWHWLLSPGSSYPAEPDGEGSEELLYVLRGRLTLQLGETSYELEAGEAIRFASPTTPYTFMNTSDRELSFIQNALS